MTDEKNKNPLEGDVARREFVALSVAAGVAAATATASAAGLPVVSTPIGAEGLPVREEENILLAGSASTFTAAVSRLLECSQLRSKLGSAGRSLLEKEFTWESAWGRLDF